MVRILAAWLVAGTLSSFTDWLFMGLLFHDRYDRFPEIWWPGIRKSESRAVLWSAALGFLGAAALIALLVFSEAHSWKMAFALAFFAWAAGPLIVIVTNGLFIKLDPLITVVHSTGYLARFLIAAAAFVFIA